MKMESLPQRVARLFDAARIREDREPRYGFSDSDGCARAQVYAFREHEKTGKLAPSSNPARWNLAAALGTAMGDFLERAARQLGDGTQVEAMLRNPHGLVITGHADWVTPTHVVDFKRADDSTWRAVQNDPKPEHVRQVNGYAAALGRPRWAILYVRNVTKGEEIPWLLHEGETSQDRALEIVEHWAEVDAHRKAGTLPERPYAQDSFACTHCRVREPCWRAP